MDETGRTTVSLKIDGWVQKLHVNFDGAMVRKGQPLLDLYSPALVATQEEYLLALENLRRLDGTEAEPDAQRLLDATLRRLVYWEVSDDQIRELTETGVVKSELTFSAPHSGEVMDLMVSDGQYIPAGQQIMDVVDVSKIWLIVDVYEEDLGRVSVGTQARIEVRSEPGRSYVGEVDYMYHMMNSELRTARARIVLPGKHDGPLKPGMFATAYLEAPETDPEVVVPEDALIRTGERDLVIVSLGSGRFRPQPVTVGVSAAGRIQILSGLMAGEQVVTNAQFLIDSEAKLTSFIASMGDMEVGTANADVEMETGMDVEMKMDMETGTEPGVDMDMDMDMDKKER